MTATIDVDILARTLFGEARNQGKEGMEAVACVVLNRARAPGWWGHSLISVCLKRSQFSCWNKDDPNYPLLKAVDEYDATFRHALEVAQKAKDGLLADSTGGATHYFERHLKPPPAWASRLTFTGRIGDHLFYK